MSSPNITLHLSPSRRQPLLKASHQSPDGPPQELKAAKSIKTHPRGSDGREDAGVYFVGTATTIIEWQGIRLLTDPNFLHAGDHVHLGPGVTSRRRTNPALELTELPPLDGILLSHYHEDHFDRVVEDSLNREFLIVTTPHAKKCLGGKEEPFGNVVQLDFFEHVQMVGDETATGGDTPAIKVTGMPGKHVPPGPLAVVNDLLGAVPPTNGWMLELGHLDGKKQQGQSSSSPLQVGYRIYISGDTLMVDELEDIPKWLQNERVDLMLVHLGGTTIPGKAAPLFMVTMDAKQGIELMRLIDPDVTIPIHYDDYDVMLSPLSDFKDAVKDAGLDDRVVCLDRGEQYRFAVKKQSVV